MAKPDLSEVLDLAYAALAHGEVKEARRQHAEACRLGAGDRDVAILEVDLLEAEGALEEAVAACEDLHERLVDDPTVAFRLATLLLDAFDDVEASEDLLRSADDLLADEDEEDAQSLRVEVLVTLADCCAAAGKVKAAQDAAARAREIAPEDPSVRLCWASTLLDSGSLDAALTEVEALLAGAPPSPDALWLKGRVLTAQGDDAAADVAFERAVELDPERFAAPLVLSDDDWDQVLEEVQDAAEGSLSGLLDSARWEILPAPRPEHLGKGRSPSILCLVSGPAEDPTVTIFARNLAIAAQDEDDLRALLLDALADEAAAFRD